MPGLVLQMGVFGLLAGLLLFHAGLSYRVHYRSGEPTAIPLMAHFLVLCGAGLAFSLHTLAIQVVPPEQGGPQAILLIRLLPLPFNGLVPFTLLLVAAANLNQGLGWRLKLFFWAAFSALLILDLFRLGGWLLHPSPAGFRLPDTLTEPAGLALILLVLLFWGLGLLRHPAGPHRTQSLALLTALALPHLLTSFLVKFGLVQFVIFAPEPLPGHASSAWLGRVSWDPLLYAFAWLATPLPATWILARMARTSSLERPTDFGLSPREREVATLVAEGRANKEIADHLHISLDTVKRHITNVYRKTGARNRVQLARRLGNY